MHVYASINLCTLDNTLLLFLHTAGLNPWHEHVVCESESERLHSDMLMPCVQFVQSVQRVQVCATLLKQPETQLDQCVFKCDFGGNNEPCM